MRLDHLLEFQRSRILTEQITETSRPEKTDKAHSGESFDEILQKKIKSNQNITFTKHAQLRMSERNITLTNDHLNRLDEAVKKAGQKGVKDTLVLIDEMAFIVSVKNSTVITALNGSDMEGNVFTQIDGAVII
jgi:flagellar operon protein